MSSKSDRSASEPCVRQVPWVQTLKQLPGPKGPGSILEASASAEAWAVHGCTTLHEAMRSRETEDGQQALSSSSVSILSLAGGRQVDG